MLTKSLKVLEDKVTVVIAKLFKLFTVKLVEELFGKIILPNYFLLVSGRIIG